MAERPSGSPAAPPRDARYGGGDALSVFLGIDDEATTTESPTRLEAQILGALAESEKPLSINEIARKTRLDFIPLSKGLVDLRRRGAITLEGSAGSEVVSLSSTA
jgi:predicted transcriptional regulator